MKFLKLIVAATFGTLHAQAQNVGIGTANPTQGKLVVNGTVGAVSAMFGSNTAGVSIMNNAPSIGFNYYYNNGEKAVTTGFGGTVGIYQGTGRFFIATSAASANTGVSMPMIERIVILPDGKIEMKGPVKIADGTQAAGKVLTSDANGNASWAAPAASSINFKSVIGANNNFMASNSITPIVLSYSGNGAFSNGAFYESSFTAPQTGVYHFDLQLSPDFASLPVNGGIFSIVVIKNLQAVAGYKQPISRTELNQDFYFSFMLQLTAGDVIGMGASQNSGVVATFSAGPKTFFSGFRVN